ncbi:hypothetical protein Poly59_30540 [Rubripirellula reticaptiva]|uniref:Uncharacterized protein n=1 Tax=Rubripirellula reticaptiva TaxID=2528013 RepID=A0A5C6EQY5_9BACT|nr:hypothetical protein Poly59_30540 [Rubripirellula reticaptiva]
MRCTGAGLASGLVCLHVNTPGPVIADVIPTNARRCRLILLRCGSIGNARLRGMSADFSANGFLEIASERDVPHRRKISWSR